MSYCDTQLHAHISVELLEWIKCFMLICLLTRLGDIPYAFFMHRAYLCGLLETIFPLFNTFVNKCQIIKGVLTIEREVRRQQWNPLSVKVSTTQATKLRLCH